MVEGSGRVLGIFEKKFVGYDADLNIKMLLWVFVVEVHTNFGFK